MGVLEMIVGAIIRGVVFAVRRVAGGPTFRFHSKTGFGWLIGYIATFIFGSVLGMVFAFEIGYRQGVKDQEKKEIRKHVVRKARKDK
jgi:hypothetical protein